MSVRQRFLTVMFSVLTEDNNERVQVVILVTSRDPAMSFDLFECDDIGSWTGDQGVFQLASATDFSTVAFRFDFFSGSLTATAIPEFSQRRA